MKFLLGTFFILFSCTLKGQSYTNGPKFILYKLVYTDMDDNIIESLDLKQATMKIETNIKLITINQPGGYYEKYYYSEYNKDIVAKGKYYDMFTIYKSFSSKSNTPLTDVLIFTKAPRTQRLTGIKLMFKDKGFITFYIK